MKFSLFEILSDIPGNVIANIIATAIISILGVLAGRAGSRSKDNDKNAVIDNSGNYISTMGGDVYNNKIYTNSFNTEIVKNFGIQRNESTQESDDSTVLIFVGSLILIGIILSGVKYLRIFAYAPLWCGGVLILLGVVFFLKQKIYYSFATKTRAVVAWLVLGLVSMAFSGSISAVQNPNSQYSLGHLSQVTERAVHPHAGWLTAMGQRTGAFFTDTSSSEKIGLYIALLVLATTTALFISAICRVLGAMLIPASSNGKVFKSKFLQNLNNNFIESKWWGYLLASVASLALWFLATDTGTEWVLNVFQQVQDFINNLVKTA